MNKTSFHERYSIDSLSQANQPLPDAFGNLFITNKFQWNADTMNVLHAGVDTIKQLYGGLIIQSMLLIIQNIYEAGHGGYIDLCTPNGEIVPFMVTSGRKGGYKYCLINKDLGVVIMMQNNHVKADLNGSHLKIELSPHLIINSTNEELQALMDNFAEDLLTQVKQVGVAIHMCCDVQGLDIPDDFDKQLTTKTRRVVNRSGISEINIPLMSSKYGAGQSFLFGRADTLQFAVYRKDIEVKENDKTHIWHTKWAEAVDDNLDPCYDPDKPVWRVELRFHHTVIAELGRDKDLDVFSYIDAVKHLTGFWRYGLEHCYRWDMNKLYIEPAWQYLIESVFIQTNQGFVFTRRLKKKPGEGNEKNIALAYGNLLSIYARKGYPVRLVMRSLIRSGMWYELVAYFKKKTGIYDDESMVRHFIQLDVEAKLKYKRVALGMAA